MDLAKSLGVERKPARKPSLVCGYDIWCPKCGYKSSCWSIDGPNAQQYIKETFRRAFSEVMYPSHANHGTFTIIKTYTKPYKK